jgi:hypothetical protein
VFFVPRTPTADTLMLALEAEAEAVAEIPTLPMLTNPTTNPVTGLATAFWVDAGGLGSHSASGAIPTTAISTGLGVTVTVAPTGRLFLDPGDASDPYEDNDDNNSDGRNDGPDEGEVIVCDDFSPPPPGRIHR